jgi:hypothetical protein
MKTIVMTMKTILKTTKDYSHSHDYEDYIKDYERL